MCSHPINLEIMYQFDNSIWLQTAASLASVLNSTTDNEDVHFHLVGEKINKTNLERILLLQKKFRSFTVESTPFDISRLEKFDTRWWNKKIMLKLYVGEIFPNLTRILVLDWDTIVLNNIRDLFEMNMDGKYVAAVTCKTAVSCRRAHGGCSRFRLTGGVMLFNLKLLRENGLQEKMVKLAEGPNGFAAMDEYGITTAVGRRGAILLPMKYNYACPGHEFLNLTEIVVLHFEGPHKPWISKKNIRRKYYNLYWKFVGMVLTD